jgi:nitroreductase
MPTREAELSIQDFPHIYPIQEQLRFLLRFAILAPSTRNTEPWRFAVDSNRILIRADLARWQPVCDADRRELHLSLGCALENILVAAEQVGLAYVVSYPPGESDEGVAAAITFQPGGAGRSPQRAGLRLETMTERRTSRGRHSEEPVSDADRRLLEGCVSDPGVSLILADDPAVRRGVAELSATAQKLSLENADFRRELAQWIGAGAFGTPWPISHAGKLAVGRLVTARQLARLEAAALESSPLLGLISSARDDRASRIASGQVLERIWLTATACGLGLQPLSAALELPEMRHQLSRAFDARLPWAQQLVRIGHPRRAGGHRTRRRPLDDVLD